MEHEIDSNSGYQIYLFARKVLKVGRIYKLSDRHKIEFRVIRFIHFPNYVVSTSYVTKTLKRTSYYIAEFSCFILSLITLDSSTSHNETPRMCFYNVSGIVNPFCVSGLTILHKDIQFSEVKNRLESDRRR